MNNITNEIYMKEDLARSARKKKAESQAVSQQSQNISKIAVYTASFIDFMILGIPRAIIIIFTGLWGNKYRLKLLEEINTTYGGINSFNLSQREQLMFFLKSDYVTILASAVLFCIAMGMCYRVTMWLSPWRATFGQRAMRIITIKRNSEAPLGIFDAIVKVILMYMVWIFPILIVGYWKEKKHLSIIFLVLTSVWNDPSFFFRKSGTLPEVASGSRYAYGRWYKRKLVVEK